MPNKIYQNDETAITFLPATQTPTVTFEVDGLASGAGRQSAQHDFGASARAYRFVWRAFVQFATAPVVDEAVRVYLKTSDGTHADNDDGTGDAAVSAEDKLKNLHHIGNIVVDEAAANVEMGASGTVDIHARYVQVVFWNGTADALTTDETENGFNLTPVPDEVQ